MVMGQVQHRNAGRWATDTQDRVAILSAASQDDSAAASQLALVQELHAYWGGTEDAGLDSVALCR